MTEDKAITLGHPSYVWRAGQERRLEMIRRHAPLEGARILDVGCGLGMYVRAFRRFSDQVYGVDVDPEKVAQASQELPHIQTAFSTWSCSTRSWSTWTTTARPCARPIA